MTKKELQSKLNELSIEFNSKMNKAELEALLPIETEKVIEVDELIECDKYEASYISKGRKHVLGTYATTKDANYYLDKAGAVIRHIQHITKH